jgi:hypothetical protein
MAANTPVIPSEWQTLDDVPQWAQECASLIATVPGLRNEQIAAYLGRSKQVIEELLESAPIQDYIARLQLDIVRKRQDSTEDMSNLRDKSIKRCLEVIEEADPKDAVAIAKFAADYHPDRAFVKMEKREERVTHTHKAGGALLAALKERHHELTNTKSAPIEIDCDVV